MLELALKTITLYFEKRMAVCSLQAIWLVMKHFPTKTSSHLDVTRESFWPVLTAMELPPTMGGCHWGPPNIVGSWFTGGTGKSAENMNKGDDS